MLLGTRLRVDLRRIAGDGARLASIRSRCCEGVSGPGFRSRLRGALMGAQVALALVVLVVAGLFLSQLP